MSWLYPNKQVEVTAATLRSRAPARNPGEALERPVVGATVNNVRLPVRHGRREASQAIPPDSGTVPPVTNEHDELRQQLIELGSAVRQTQPDGVGSVELTPAVARLVQRLSDAEVPAAVAKELIETIRTDVPEAKHDDGALLSQRLIETVANDLATTGGIRIAPGQRCTVALVGPAGVGKTTMIAKLAADFHLRQSRSVALITTDNFRIAAVDQLQNFADLIGVPLMTASTPRDMRIAQQQLAGHDLVLIDTPGRSPRDDLKRQEIRSLLVEAEPDEIHLVQSCSSGSSHVGRCLDQFAVFGLAGMMLTKFDEAIAAGHLLPLLQQSALPVSYLSDGQIVPDDMHVAKSHNLAERFLIAHI